MAIDGLVIKYLDTYSDDRGWLTEIFRTDEDNYNPVMCYVSHTDKNVVRGPHEHKEQTDLFAFVGYGDFKLYLWDNRPDSVTYNFHMLTLLGESCRAVVKVPPGVVHGYKAVSDGGGLVLNLPDKLYRGEGKKDEVDEIRHEDDTDSIFRIK